MQQAFLSVYKLINRAIKEGALSIPNALEKYKEKTKNIKILDLAT